MSLRLSILAFLLLGATALAQSGSASQSTPATCPDDNSLAAAACRNRAQKPRAKKVVTDEDLDRIAGPLPPLNMNTADNGDEVIAAIRDYKKDHTAQETEDAVRKWYDKYDDELAAAIRDTLQLNSIRTANMDNAAALCEETNNWRNCQKRQMAEVRGQRRDRQQMGSDGDVVVRIQHAFMNVRNGLAQNGLGYEWFKVRTTNNVDKF